MGCHFCSRRRERTGPIGTTSPHRQSMSLNVALHERVCKFVSQLYRTAIKPHKRSPRVSAPPEASSRNFSTLRCLNRTWNLRVSYKKKIIADSLDYRAESLSTPIKKAKRRSSTLWKRASTVTQHLNHEMFQQASCQYRFLKAQS